MFAIRGLDGATGAAVYVPAGTAVEERRVEYHYDPDDHLASLDFDNELQGDLRLKPNVSLPNHEIADDEVTVDTAEHPRAEELREVWEEIWGEERWIYKWSHLQIGGYAPDAEGWGDPVVNCARETADPGIFRTGRFSPNGAPRWPAWRWPPCTGRSDAKTWRHATSTAWPPPCTPTPDRDGLGQPIGGARYSSA